jgi:hypothetical protein
MYGLLFSRSARMRAASPIIRLYYRAGTERIPQMSDLWSDLCELRGIRLPRTPVNKGKSEGPRPLSKEPRPHTLAYRLILNVPRRR